MQGYPEGSIGIIDTRRKTRAFGLTGTGASGSPQSQWIPAIIVEVYSIDEAFLHVPKALPATHVGLQARETVEQWTGIPVSIGIAKTKTLSKIAGKVAKKAAWTHGVFDLHSWPDTQGLLSRIAVSDVWGIGGQYTKLLHKNRVYNALELSQLCDAWVKRHMTVVGLRTVWELRGISCIPLDQARTAKKGIINSRSFGEATSRLQDVKEAVASFAARAAERLREQGSVASALQVFATTKPYGEEPHYMNSATVELPVASSYTPTLIRYAHEALQRIWREGYRYKKAGVMLKGITPREAVQGDLFTAKDDEERSALMEVMDRINQVHGRGSVFFAATGAGQRRWHGEQAKRSPRYTTRWGELVQVRAR